MRVRIRRIAKWGCLSLGAALLVVAFVGNWRVFGYRWARSTGGNSGSIIFQATNLNVFVRRSYLPAASNFGERRWRWLVNSPSSQLPRWVSDSSGWSFWLPISNIGALVLGVGIVIWHFDHLRAAHECPKCRYDRRGLADGAVCPECGAG